MMKPAWVLGMFFCGMTVAGAEENGFQPTRPVTLVVPYSAGGGTDAAARALAKQLGEIWRQPVVVHNAPGADGLIGTRRVIDAEPDGYTLLLQVPSIALSRFLPSSQGADPLQHLEPISLVAKSPSTFTVSGKSHPKTMAEFVDTCKQPAAACSMGAGENIGRLLSRQFAQEQQIPDLAVANYKGTAPIVTDLVAGNIDGAFMGFSAVLPQHKTGAVRILAIAARERTPQLPEVPTVAEAGFPDFTAETWYGLFAPQGTPASITNAIADAARTALKDDALVRALAAGGAVPVGSTPLAFADQVASDSQRLGTLAERFPIQ